MATDRAELSVNGWNSDYIEQLYRRWSDDPDAVDPQWQQFFAGFDLGHRTTPAAGAEAGDSSSVAHTGQAKVDSLIYHYRDIGHFAADLDPLGTQRPFPEMLTLDSFGLSDAELGERFDPGVVPLSNPALLGEIIELLEDTYCRHIGVEYMHLQDRERRRWLQQRMEGVRNAPSIDAAQKLHILQQLIEADGFESFLDTRYKGKKRFGLDGGESLIPMLDQIIELGPSNRVQEYAIGMAHRGRLNVLVNIMHKTYDQIFTEFEEAWVEDFIKGGGDVKYHRGYSADHVTRDGDNVRLTLSPNPSHLEFVNAVVLGRARAKQRVRKDEKREQCVPILIHGDASFPAQGVVAECFNMMKLDGYTVGGTIHIVINNQVGFTTNANDARSGEYCTDIAKMVQAPIFHVNGDDPEACTFIAKLALEWRQAFKHDIVIDMWCYRKFGHNEGDEPTFTQPLMYERIRKQKPVLKKYVEKLVGEKVITQSQFDALYEKQRVALDEAQTRTRERPVETSVNPFGNVWAGLAEKYSSKPIETGVSKQTLNRVARVLGSVPEGFALHKKLVKSLEYAKNAIENDEPLNWAMGELLAYGTLLTEGHAVRLTGQDVERGTFSHRHAVLFDQNTGEGYTPLNNITNDQARFCVHNSPLTESACVGFEYGYSLGDPNMLIIWEAQFGDFANGAQVYFDQFVASAEVKWKRFSGLTLFLPHGYEGQGPEHSSARMDRWLAMCARDNIQVVYPTTPAQMFHLLRRQMKRNFRKPLVVLTPKSLLRLPEATSRVDELVKSRFHRVLEDPTIENPDAITRVLLCTGKIYYDLIAHRDKAHRDDVAVIRIEQLYPFAESRMTKALQRYPNLKETLWVQEEVKNMGAWRYMREMLQDRMDLIVPYVGRDENASPAVASTKMHAQEQERIMIAAIGLPSDSGDARAEEHGGGGRSGSRIAAAQ